MHMANNVKNAKVTHGKRTFNEISVMFQNQLDFPIAQSTHLIRKIINVDKMAASSSLQRRRS